MDGSDLTAADAKEEVIRLRKLLHDHADYTEEEVRDRVSPQLIESQWLKLAELTSPTLAATGNWTAVGV